MRNVPNATPTGKQRPRKSEILHSLKMKKPQMMNPESLSMSMAPNGMKTKLAFGGIGMKAKKIGPNSLSDFRKAFE